MSNLELGTQSHSPSLPKPNEPLLQENLFDFKLESDLNEYIYNCKQLEIPVDPAVASTLATKFPIMQPTGEKEACTLLPLLRIMKNCTFARTLSLPPRPAGTSGNNEAHILGIMIADNQSLTHLSLRGMNITAEGLASICAGLKRNRRVQRVDLADNYIGPDAVPYLVELLEVNNSITHLNISNNNLEYQGEQAIRAAAWNRNTEHGVSLTLESYGNYVYEGMLNSVVMGIGVIMSAIAFFLLLYSMDEHTVLSVRLARLVYGVCIFASYLSATFYHATHQSARWLHKMLKVLSHCSNFFLIAGIYTVIIEEGLKPRIPLSSYIMLGEWFFCVVGIVVHIAVSYWRESILLTVLEALMMLLMGWAALLVVPWVIKIFTTQGIVMIFVGGGLYTVGIVFYFIGVAMPIWRVIFSIFVIFGSLTIFVGIFFYMDIGGKTISGTII